MAFSKRLIAAMSLASFAATWVTSASAQVQTPSREQVNPPAPQSEVPKSEARVDENEAFQPGPCPLADSDIKVAINRVSFTAPGGGALAPELAQLLADIGTSSESKPIRVVCDIRDQANARLRIARYVASVQIPAQRIDDGVLRLEVVAGHIVEVRVRGEAGPFENLIRKRIELIKQLNPLNANEAERLLLLANDIPGLNIKLGLSPSGSGSQPGDLVGEMTVSYRRFSMIGNIQNYNSKFLGRETIYLRGEYYNLFGQGDRTYLAGSTTLDFNKQRIVQLGQSFTLSSRGDRLSLIATMADSRPALDTIDLRTVSLIGNIEYSRPLVRSVDTKIDAALGFEYAQQRTRVYSTSSSVPLNRDRIATVYARLEAAKRKLRSDGSEAWDFGGSLEFRKGLNILGATKPGQIIDGYAPTRFQGSSTATLVRGQINGMIGLGPIFELATTMRGQWANRELLNYDQFAIGNLTIGRGYDPGANTGDRAIGGAHELRANVQVGSNTRGQIYGFYDWVKLWNLDPSSTERNRTLASVGGGVRVSLLGSMRLDLTYAHPLDPPLLTGVNIKPPPDRFMFSLTAQLIPFGARR